MLLGARLPADPGISAKRSRRRTNVSAAVRETQQLLHHQEKSPDAEVKQLRQEVLELKQLLGQEHLQLPFSGSIKRWDSQPCLTLCFQLPSCTLELFLSCRKLTRDDYDVLPHRIM